MTKGSKRFVHSVQLCLKRTEACEKVSTPVPGLLLLKLVIFIELLGIN